MKRINQKPNNEALGKMWNLLFFMIFLCVFLVISALGYFILKDNIEVFLNKKEYSKEELIKLDKRGMMNLSIENEEKNWDLISNGIHLRTGLHADSDLKVVIAACTSCHSAKLITQNKASRSGWKSMIDWMQATQGLPDLGTSEPIILDYLAKYYSPKDTGRRKNIDLEKVEWYVLDLEN